MYLSINGCGTFSTCSIDSAIACPMAQKSFDVSFKLKAVETAEKTKQQLVSFGMMHAARKAS